MTTRNGTIGIRRPSAFPFILFALFLLALPRTGSGAEEEDHGHDHGAEAAAAGHEGEEGAHEEKPILLTEAERKEFGIVMAVAGPGDVSVTIDLPGEIRANQDRLAHIVPRFEGIVNEVRVGLGEQVAPGQTLAVVESDESLSPYDVKTLVAGTVIEKHATRGEAVSRNEALFVIADLSTVWVDLAVYQRDLARIRPGSEAAVRVGHEESSASSRVVYVAPVIDEISRTATARLVLPNPEGRWKPGMFVNALVVVDDVRVPVAVPPTAIHFLDGGEAVFVEEEHGFVPRPVATGRRGSGLVEILSGLDEGEAYVREGGFLLKSEHEKESFGHAGHAH